MSRRPILLCCFVFCISAISCNNDSTSSQLTKEQETGQVSDIDGNVYKTVKIGDQWWLAENLKVTHYRNGVQIPNIKDHNQWKQQKAGAYCVYSNNPIYFNTFGYLYNYYAIKDTQGLAPEGWHVATDEDWFILEQHLGLEKKSGSEDRGIDIGGQLKESGYAYWNSPNTGAINSTGFSARPGGQRYDGRYLDMGSAAYFWSPDGRYSDDYYRILESDNSYIGRDDDIYYNGFSVRCVKNID